LGIDEAGRGPVLGPMVYGACYCALSQKAVLNSTGFADSKTLDDEQRNVLFDKLNAAPETFGWIVDILSPNYISNSMLRRTKYNLNQVSHDTAIGLIRSALELGVKLTEVYVDTVGDPGKYQEMLKSVFPHLDITVAKKADSTYPIVSAASICAKVARDRVVSRWKFIENIPAIEEYGSGYPSDPKTKQFLNQTVDNVFGYRQFVRFSWSTADVLLRDKASAVHWEDDDDDDKKATDTSVPSVLSFFQSEDVNKVQHAYFVERSLKPFVSF
jgi:ribonuclease H2 subunit A